MMEEVARENDVICGDGSRRVLCIGATAVARGEPMRHAAQLCRFGSCVGHTSHACVSVVWCVVLCVSRRARRCGWRGSVR